jgi:hypothetical protein
MPTAWIYAAYPGRVLTAVMVPNNPAKARGLWIDIRRRSFENALKSYLRSVEFFCHSNALRNYINKLQEYGLPVILRSLTISNENKGSSENAILSTEKVKISIVLEWLSIRDEKDVLKSEDKE